MKARSGIMRELTDSDLSGGASGAHGGALFFHRKKKIRGHALVMAVVFVFFLTLFGLAFYRFAETDVDLIGSDRNAMEALYAAQAGIQKASWILKHHRAIAEGGSLSTLNPFSTAFYTADGPLLQNFQQVAHDNQDFLSPGGNELPRYFRVNWVDARGIAEDNQKLMNRVRVQVLGALDVDGDGVAGLIDMDVDNFPVDRDDVNRKFESVIGLPGSLGENLSAGAPDFTSGDGSTSITFTSKLERLVTQDGYDVPQESGFLYYQLGELAGWDQYSYIFGKPMRQGEIELPPGLFDDEGKPVLEYFSGLDPRVYNLMQVFDRDNDPTEGADGRQIIYVNGDVTIRGVDFGYLDSSGILRGADWAETDVTIVSTGTITAKDIQCGNVGRLTLIAKDILLVGDYDTRINGIALASGTITLDDQEIAGDPHGCPYEILKNAANPAEPLRYTAYFMGTILAGSIINLKNAGWTILFDEKVINGLMYDTTLSKPTRVYETAENEDGKFPYPKWQKHGNELDASQETYTPEEIDAGVAASWDLGGDDTPDVMRVYQKPKWVGTDDHDFGVTDEVELDFEDIGIGLQDWTNYRDLTFWMSLDNWKKVSGSRETSRMFYFRVRLEDDADQKAFFGLPNDGFYLSDYHSAYDSIYSPGSGAWKKVRIPLARIDPTRSFDITTLDEVRFYLYNIVLSWYNAAVGRNQWIDHDPDGSTGYGSDGLFVFHLGYDFWGRDEYPVRFRKDGTGKYKLYYTDARAADPHQKPGDPGYNSDYDHDIQWNPNPATPTVMEDLYFEDHLNPNMRIDQIQLPGRPDSNAILEYGLPRCFRYAVTHLTEYKTF